VVPSAPLEYRPECSDSAPAVSPKNISYLTPKELQELGLKREQLRELAVRNLKRLLPKIEFHGGNGVYMLTAGGDYEANCFLGLSGHRAISL
jgi:hypothetical protein